MFWRTAIWPRATPPLPPPPEPRSTVFSAAKREQWFSPAAERVYEARASYGAVCQNHGCIITIPLFGIPSSVRPPRPVTGYLEVSQAWITTRDFGCHFDLNVLPAKCRSKWMNRNRIESSFFFFEKLGDGSLVSMNRGNRRWGSWMVENGLVII